MKSTSISRDKQWNSKSKKFEMLLTMTVSVQNSEPMNQIHYPKPPMSF